MSQVATMSVKFAADIAGFEKNVTKAEKTFLASAKSMTKMGEELSLKLTAPFLAITGVMAKSAADAEASMARFTRIFGPATDQVDAFATQMMKVLPETRSEIEQLLGTTQAFVAQLGLAPRATIAMTESLTKLAGDIAAFRHLDISDVMQTLERGMAGRTQGLVGLGIAINKAEVAEKAYSMGLATQGEKLTVAAQSQATMALAMEKTKNIQGEAAKTAGDAANALKFLHQATTELAEEWGKDLLPMATSLIHSLTDVTHEITGAADSTKVLVFGIGAVAAAAGPLLIVAGSLIRNFTEVARVMRMVAGAEGLMALAAGGALVVAVVAGLAAIGYWFYKSGEDARNAKASVDDYKASLAGLSDTQLIGKVSTAYQNLEFLKANLQAAKDAKPGRILLSPGGPGGMPTYATDVAGHNATVAAAQAAYDQGLKVAQTATSAYNNAAQLKFVKPTKAPGSISTADPYAGLLQAMGPGISEAERMVGIVMRDNNMTIGDTIDHAKVLTSAFDASNDKLKLFPLFLDQANAMAAKARETLERFPSPLQDANIQAHQLLNTLAPILQYGTLAERFKIFGYNQTDPVAAFNQFGGFGATGTSAGGVGDAGKIFTPIVGELDTLGGVFRDAIANQAQFIAQSLTTVLGVRNANAGGAIGSVLGGGIAGAMAKGMMTDATGAMIGGVLGSAVPVVGTILGSLAGGLIGNSIGKLFGGGGAAKSATTALGSLATAAQKVTEALSNAPTGFKIALDRFRVSDPSAIPLGASLPAGYGPAGSGVTFNGPVTVVTQAQTADQLYRDLAARARRDGLRGGTTQWQLASSPAGI